MLSKCDFVRKCTSWRRILRKTSCSRRRRSSVRLKRRNGSRNRRWSTILRLFIKIKFRCCVKGSTPSDLNAKLLSKLNRR